MPLWYMLSLRTWLKRATFEVQDATLLWRVSFLWCPRTQQLSGDDRTVVRFVCDKDSVLKDMNDTLWPVVSGFSWVIFRFWVGCRVCFKMTGNVLTNITIKRVCHGNKQLLHILCVCMCVGVTLYCIVVGSRQLMPPYALQPKAYCTNPGL